MKRKIAGLILLITVAIVVGYLALVSWLAGFLIAKYGGGKSEGMRGRVRSIKISLGMYRLHLHHWLICSVVMVIAIVRSFYLFFPPEMFLSFMSGVVFQGIYCYSDWRRIIHRRHPPHELGKGQSPFTKQRTQLLEGVSGGKSP